MTQTWNASMATTAGPEKLSCKPTQKRTAYGPYPRECNTRYCPATSKVKVNYEGRLVDGTVFDSSYERKQPATFGCNQVIKGWTEALTQMPVGSKWEIYIPQELGYGSREAGKIPPFSALIFTVELLEIEK